ncbi:ABC transporter permease [Mesosutterella sp. OilRF-GAM-744-9]|uniref:ABC transporter permease n=1 Tax=Mesosutterella porci TaxID=2915351 RepID=A0ABS9MQU1_9BURK|nr:ABC transporter permease [Mesosutterella sp. oilRF-744-WT-GAM-9]MCG5030757.1 ABC transporter permease [Mesosutterella sp. oilRF-744-WT-GAM-9]
MPEVRRGRSKWLQDIIDSMFEELEAMTSGHFVPYHKLSVMAAVVTTVVLGLFFTQMSVIEAPVAVIDLDRTTQSAALISALDSSRDIRVAKVVRSPVNPESLLRQDELVGVIYIPRGLTESVLTGRGLARVGYFADQTNAAQNGEVFNSLSEVATAEGVPVSAANLAALGAASQASESASSSGIGVEVRRLFNPANSLHITVLAFLYFFSGIYFGITSLMIMGRLHVSGLWETTICERGLSALVARLFPYCLGYCAAVTLMTAALVQFDGLPFKGNYLAYLPSLFLLPLCIGLLAMIVTWRMPTPANGAAFMIFIVPPGFIMGGMTMAEHEFPGWVHYVSNAFPLTWQFGMLRDFAFRGKTLSEMAGPYGEYLLYATVLLALAAVRFYAERRRLGASQKNREGVS